MKVLIAGAGIGGLCAALCLQKSGHDVHLIEQAPDFSRVGAGLQLGANALKVLDYLGLVAQLQSVSVAPKRVDFRSGINGGVLHSAELGARYLAKYGAPYWHIHRADLHTQLLASLGANTRLQQNSRIVRYQEYGQSVSVELADGQRIDGDCLIGADGLRSVVRSTLFDGATPVFTGNVAWRGVIPVEKLPANFMDKVVTNFVGPNKHMVIYYLREQQLVNFVGVVANTDQSDQSWISRAPWQELKRDFAGWHPMVQVVIDAMDKAPCYRWALFKHKPFTPWSSKRVTLLGDAAHSTLPFLASGAAMAIEDARILQRSIDQTDTVEQALQRYQRNRFARTAKIQKLSSQIATLYHMRYSTLQKMAFKALKPKSTATEGFLASYDANTIPLT